MSQKGFDFWVHHRDKKTGKVVSENAYSMELTRDGTYIRRGGKCYAPDGSEIPDPRHAKSTQPNAKS